jgi:hypothetical protein
MAAKVGDRIHMLGKIKKANPNERAGVIEAVLSEDPPRYEIRWDSGRLTVMAPLPGAIRIETAPRRSSRSANGKAAAKKPAAKPAAKTSAKTSAKPSTKPAARSSSSRKRA